MINTNFTSIDNLKEYMNQSLKLSSNSLFLHYLSKIYSDLIKREEPINNTKSKRFSREQNNSLFLQKDLSVNNLIPDKFKDDDLNMSLNVFLDYINIQEYIGKRIFQILKKSEKSQKLNKDDFCNGLYNIYYGNIEDIIEFTFRLADFDKDGKVYQSDMKLILAYIPASTEFSQKNYLKQIDKIFNQFFEEKIKANEIIINSSSEELTDKQINLEVYKKYIKEYDWKKNDFNLINSEFLYDYQSNAPFFYFISIISYIFKNIPFDIKTIEIFAFKKKKMLLNVEREREREKKGWQSLRTKNLLATENKKSVLKLMNNTKADSFFKRASVAATTHRYSVHASSKRIKEALPKIGKTNLFNVQKSCSEILIKKNSEQIKSNINLIKNKSKRTSTLDKYKYILPQKKHLSNRDLPSVNLYQDKNSEISLIQKYAKIKKKKLSPINHELNSNNEIPKNAFRLSSSQSPDLKKKTANLFLNKSNNNEINKEKIMNMRTKLPSLSIGQKKYSPIIGPKSFNIKEDEKNDDIDEPEEFVLCEYSENDNDNSNGRDSNKSDNTFPLNETYLYKYDENDFHQNILNKYYALIKEKEIIFFTTEQKNEFCDIWYINKSYISTGKETVSNTNYFIINIVFENNFVKKLYFLNENLCQSYSLTLKNAVKNFNFYDYYEIVNSLGQGNFGSVNRCKNKETGDIYAVKIINKSTLKSKDVELIRQEKNILNLIKHENITSLKDFFEDKQNIYFVTELYEGGDLLSFIEEKYKEGEKISEKVCAKIIRKIALGLHYLNLFGIIHRDIKPENIMFGRPYNIKSLKIIDLGVCQILSYGEKAKEPIGTNGYIPPEIYLHEFYSFKIDIWSLGVILYCLITGGILPFDDANLDKNIIAKKVIYLQHDYPENYFGDKSKKLKYLLDKMLEKKEDKRIDIYNLLKDSWFDIIKR